MPIKTSFCMPLLLLAAFAAAHTGPAGSATSATAGATGSATGATAGLRRSGDDPFKTNGELYTAAQDWCAGGSNETAVVAKYGEIKDWDVSQITSMSELFKDQGSCNPPIGKWNVSKVKNMDRMFRDASEFNQNLNNWKVGQVTDMSQMFYGASKFNGDISSWFVVRVTKMREMFSRAKSFDQPLNNWDVGEVTDMHKMFEGARAFNQNLNSWDVRKVTTMQQMFYGATAFDQLLCWDTEDKMTSFWLEGTSAANIGPMNDSKVCEFTGFKSKQILQGAVKAWCRNQTETAKKTEATFGPIKEWDVSEITDMSWLFANQAICNPPIGNWDVSKVKNMDRMFDGAKKFDRNLNNWDVSQVTTMYEMFWGASAFDQPLNWKVDQVKDMRAMFAGASAFNQLLCWNTTKASPSADWLEETAAALLRPGERSEDAGVCAFNLTTQPFAPSNQLLKYAARRWCSDQSKTKTTFGPIQNWNVSQVTGMSRLFKNQATCNPPIGSWDVSQVKDMDRMFQGATAFNQNLNCWDVSQVTSMKWMFYEASNFSQTLCWDTSGKLTWSWLTDAADGAKSVPAGLCGVLNPWGQCKDKGIWHNNWIPILLGLAAAAAVLVFVLVKVDSEDQLDEPPPTLWEQIKTALARVTGLDDQKLSAHFDRRSSSDSSVVQIHTASPTEAYTVIQALSTTSSGTLTQMVVQQLQATNYTGPMPTMITAVVQSVTNAGSSSDSGSDNRMILVAVVVAAVCLLLALLVIGALVYLWKRNTQPVQNQEQATPHEITMGSVGVSMNPMHAAATKPLE